MPPVIGIAVAGVLGESLAGTVIIGATAASSALTLGGLVTGIVEVGLVAGASLLMAANRQVKADQSNLQPPTVQSVGPQSISPRYFAAGRVLVGGVRHWYECLDTQRAVIGIVLNCEPIDGIEIYLVDGENLHFTYGPFPELTNFLNGVISNIDLGPNVGYPNGGLKFTFQYTQKWTGQAWQPYPIGILPAMAFEFLNGSPSGATSKIVEHFNNPIWSANQKCVNLACLYAMARAGQVIVNRMAVYPKAFPEISAVIRGAKIYDPRDPTQILTDPTTWKWSRNSALIIAWYLTHPDGGRLAVSRVSWPDFVTAADYCDRLVTAFGGVSEKWAQTDCQWHTGEAVRDVLARLQAACDATMWEDGDGLWRIFCLQAVTPTVTITDTDISSIEIEQMNGALDEVNYLTPSYMEPRENYQTIPGPIVRDDASIAAVGERAQTITLKEVASFSQAYRLAWRAMKRKNPELKLAIVGGPSLLRCIGEIVVSVQSAAAQISGTFRLTDRVKVSPSGAQITISLALVGDHDYDDVVPPYDPVSPYEANVVVTPPAWPIAVPDAPSLTQETVSGSKYIDATATWHGAPPPDTSLIYYAQYRQVDASHNPIGGWQAFPTNISEWIRQSDVVTVGNIYECSGWFVQDTYPGAMSASSFITIT